MSQRLVNQGIVSVKARKARRIDPLLFDGTRRLLPDSVITEKGLAAEIIRQGSPYAGANNIHVGKIIVANPWNQDVNNALWTACYEQRLDRREQDKKASDGEELDDYFEQKAIEERERRASLKVV